MVSCQRCAYWFNDSSRPGGGSESQKPDGFDWGVDGSPADRDPVRARHAYGQCRRHPEKVETHRGYFCGDGVEERSVRGGEPDGIVTRRHLATRDAQVLKHRALKAKHAGIEDDLRGQITRLQQTIDRLRRQAARKGVTRMPKKQAKKQAKKPVRKAAQGKK